MGCTRSRVATMGVATLLLLALLGSSGASAALAAPGATADSDDVVDEDGAAGPLVEGADSAGEVDRATAVEGSATADRTGVWTDAVDWPLSAIHAIVLPDGRVLTYGTDGGGTASYAFSYDVWDPSKGLGPGSHTTLPVKTSTNLFCSAQALLPWSGQVLITGGDEHGFPGGLQNDAVNDVNVFDPSSSTVTRLADSMSRARWYPTVTTLPDGRLLVHGGRDDNPKATPTMVPEVYDPTDGWIRLTGAASSKVYGGGRWFYPRSWVAPDGNVFIVTKGNHGLWSLDPDGKGSVRQVGTYPGASINNSTPAVMFGQGRILVTTETGSASVINLNGATPTVTATGSLDSYRSWSDATVLADGQVLVTGGASERQKLDHAVYEAELWDPATGVWRDGASAHKARLYHSTSLLLPDATVLTAGGGPPGPVVNLNAEIYHPPYLYKDDGSGELASRPTISSIGTVGYGNTFTVGLGGDRTISKVTLVRTASVTHSFDMSQRFQKLSFTQSGNQLTVTGPRDANVAPPGQYMLFVVDDRGVPSVARLLRLNTATPPSSAAVQTGTMTLANTAIGGDWITATFKRPFDRTPVVTVGAPSTAGYEPVGARVRNVTRTGFEVKLDEWGYQDGEHTLETLSYLAAEPGRHTLGGVTIEAGAMTGGDDLRHVTYDAALPTVPVVLTQVASASDGTAVTTRVRDVHKTGFNVRLQEQEANTGQHGQETVHYIALSTGTGTLAGEPVRVGRTGVVVTDAWHKVWFGSHAEPSFMAAAQTTKGTDPAGVRYRSLHGADVQVKVQEEQSQDGETGHTAERIGWVVVGAR